MKRVLSVVLCCIIGTGSLALLIAAINNKNSRICKGIDVQINQGSKQLFVDKREILNMLSLDKGNTVLNKKIASVDLKKMEETIERNVWIKDAELFFDNSETLRIRILERVPVARMITLSGESFYIDSNGVQMPLGEKSRPRLLVFTGLPDAPFRLHGKDSALNEQIRELAIYINRDVFWSRDIEQVNITNAKTFEMVPVIGNHIIEFGDGNDCQQKFHRLFVFYREMMAVTGFDKYCRVKVGYEGQVVGTKKGGYISRADSLQAIKNVNELIRLSYRMQTDSVKQPETKPLEHNNITEQMLKSYDLPDDEDSMPENKDKKKKINN